MKRTSFIFLILFRVLIVKLHAQVPSFIVTPNTQCFTGSNTYTAFAAITLTTPGATSYTWGISGPGSCQGNTLNPAPTGTSISLSFSCCGIYTVICVPLANGGIPMGANILTQTLEIVCPGGGTVTSTGSTPNGSNPGEVFICAGTTSSVSFSAPSSIVSSTLFASTGGINYVAGLSNPALVTPSANTSYTMIGTTAGGCTIAATKTISVQKADLQITPSYTELCIGSTIGFNAVAVAVNTAGYTSGTSTTTISWYAPAGTSPFTIGAYASTAAVVGSYSAILTHSGSAGSCTVLASAYVNNSLQPLLSAALPSACPSSPFTLSTNVSPNSTFSVFAPSNSIIATGNYSTTSVAAMSYSNLPATYTIVADSAGCKGSYSFTLQKFILSRVQLISTTNALCAGKSATLTTFGVGNNSLFPTYYSYAVLTNTVPFQANTSPSIVVSPTTQTSYVVVADSLGCTGATSITINVAPPINIAISPSSATTCIGSNSNSINLAITKPVALTATGAASYTWEPHYPGVPLTGPQAVVRPMGTTQYTVVGITAVCSGSAMVTVSVIPQYTISVTPAMVSICLGQTALLGPPNVGTLAAGQPAQFSYAWTTTNTTSGTFLTSPFNATVATSPTSSATYYVEVLDANNCVSTLAQVIVNPDNCTGIETNVQNWLTVFPNPAHNQVTLNSYSVKKLKLEVLDVLGRSILSKEIDFSESTTQTIGIGDLRAGVYYLRYETYENSWHLKKIIKE